MQSRIPPVGPKLSAEQEKQARAFRAEDIKRARLFEGMMKHEAWPYFVELLNKGINDRMGNVLEATPDDKQLASEHNKGIVYGMILVRDMLPVIVAGYQQFTRESGSDKEETKQ